MAHVIAMEDEVRIYLLSDRQWKREQRLAHAHYKLETTNTAHDKTFWSAVLDAVSLHNRVPRRS